MSIDAFAGAGPSVSEQYQPVSIVAVTVPIALKYFVSLDAQRILREALEQGMFAGQFEDVDHTVRGTIFRDSGGKGGYAYNVWHGPMSGIGGGWNDDQTFEDDVKTFKRFPSCILLMEDVFYQRIQRMATAAGSTMYRFDFAKPELLRAA